jgi:two-component system chemotaxis sensor kinase CheA
MDISDYLPMFLAEGREHLQTLNLSLVKIEQDPTDRETINDIFRVAHTLKGMSATMGFARMAALTHEMENVMEGMKTSEHGLRRDALDALFGCLDVLEKLVDEIEESGAEQSDPTGLVATLKQIRTGEIAAEAAFQDAAHEPVAGAEADAGPESANAPAADVIASVESSGMVVARVDFTLAADVDMPGVRTYLAVRKAEEHGEMIACEPDIGVIERGEIETTSITVWVATSDDLAAVAETVLTQDGIATCTATRAVAGKGAPRPAAAPAAAEPAAAAVTAEAAPVAPVALHAVAEPATSAKAPAAGPAGKQHKAQTVRVEAERLDQLMHMMGEMVVQRTRLESIAQHAGQPDLQTAVNDLSRVAQSLQQMVMQVRMVPVESVFMRFPRMVRDIATKLGKTVDLQIKGEDTELDRTVVEALGDPLVHLVRNAMDHGLEGPDERTANGKPPGGTLEIAAEHAGGEVLIRVREDGRGVNAARVAKIAAERGLITADQVANITTEDAIELLFMPGFSTAEVTTDISGRGVGMDAVRTMVRNLGGDCTITSVLGKGSTATIRLPLSLAILPALLVEVNEAPYALPLERVEQTIRISDYTLRSIKGANAIVLREKILPLYDLGWLLGGTPLDPTNAAAVVCRAGANRVGLLVERLVGQQELVTRPLPAVTDAQRALVSGGAVLGNGQIALIVDLDALGKQTKAA